MKRTSLLSKPTVFIGSSTEGLPVAKKLGKRLSRTAKCTIWTMQGLFGLGKFTLDVLIQATREHDFAVLVLTSDDFLNQRGVPTNVPRDNVIFELGLFMGAIGKERSFIVHDKGITLPTDLDGVTRASFSTLDLNSAYQMLKEAIVGAPGRGRDLNGRWFSAYQRHDDKLGRWVRDIVEIQCRSSGKLTFRNYNDPQVQIMKRLASFTVRMKSWVPGTKR